MSEDNQTPITKKQFLADVVHEITMLKKHATKLELGRLNFVEFNAKSEYDCIYGQMTRKCDSKRAKALMNKACIRVIHNVTGVEDIENQSYAKISKFVNGAYQGQMWKGTSFLSNRAYNFLSALESYICLKDAKIEHILEFLKDETNTIKLKL